MIQSLWSAATGMEAQQLKVDAIANNLANVNTPGYKAARVTFADLLYLSSGEPGEGAGQEAMQVGTGVRAGGIVRDFAQGPLEETGVPWDLALEGPGFLAVRAGDGQTAYRRGGSLHVSPSGDGRLLLVDEAGNPVLGGDGQPVALSPEEAASASVDAGGKLVVRGTDGLVREAGRLAVYVFPNPGGLSATGNGLFRPTAASGEAREARPEDGVAVRQGMLEGSNVQVVGEMVSLIVAQRGYELAAKAIQSSDQMLEIANNLRR